MTLDPAFEAALSSSDPGGSLRAMAMDRLARGHDRSAIVSSFEEARQQLRNADREADEDAMMDALDCLVGWCSPHMLLAPAGDPPGRADSPANGGNPSATGTPASFDVLTNEIRGLGLNMQLEKKRI